MAIRTNGLFLIIWFVGYHGDVVVLFFGESEHSDNTCFRSIFFYPAVMLLGRFPVLNYTHKHFGSNPQIPVFDKKLTKIGCLKSEIIYFVTRRVNPELITLRKF